MRGIKLYFITVVLLATGLSLFGQNIDSLLRVANEATKGEKKLENLIRVCELDISTEVILPYLLEAEKLSKNSTDEKILNEVKFSRALYYARKGDVDSALFLIDGLIKKEKVNKNDQHYYLKYLFFKAKFLDRANQYTAALKELVNVIETASSLRDTVVEIQAKTGIGWVQMELEQYNEALVWLLEALHTSPNPVHYRNYGALYSNLASCYNSIGRHDSAMYYIKVAIEDARKYNNSLFLATALSMQAKIFIDGGTKELAEKPLHEVLEIRKKLNDPFYSVFDMSSVASYYASIGQPEKGIALCKEGIQVAKNKGLSSQLLMIYRALAENYKVAGDNKSYGETLEYIIALKDSFNIINTAKQVSSLQAANEAQRKEKEIAEQQLALTRKNYWFYGSVVFIAMSGIIAFLGFLNYRRKQQMKIQLMIDEEKRNSASAVKEAEEQERKRIAADLHDNIGAYASAISADVDKLSVDRELHQHASVINLKSHSREIISSLRDTIWVLKKEDITLTAVSDRIKNYIAKLGASYPGITITISEEIDEDIKVGSNQALNLFRIIQEALHNSLKHSMASHIYFSITGNEKGFIVVLKDNGQGIGERQRQGGNGLQNIRLRAVESGFDVEINSVPGKGTEIKTGFQAPT